MDRFQVREGKWFKYVKPMKHHPITNTNGSQVVSTKVIAQDDTHLYVQARSKNGTVWNYRVAIDPSNDSPTGCASFSKYSDEKTVT